MQVIIATYKGWNSMHEEQEFTLSFDDTGFNLDIATQCAGTNLWDTYTGKTIEEVLNNMRYDVEEEDFDRDAWKHLMTEAKENALQLQKLSNLTTRLLQYQQGDYTRYTIQQ